MAGRIGHYRIRLIAYDGAHFSQWRLPLRIPSPSPTPLMYFVRKLRKRLPRRVRLVRLRGKTGHSLF